MRKGLEHIKYILGVHYIAKKPKVATAVLVPLWPKIVGSIVASHCRPVSFEDGTLSLVCDGSVWTAELNNNKTTILDRIREIIGKPVVKELNFIIKKEEQTKLKPKKARTEIKISEKRFAWAESVASEVPREHREEFLKAMLTAIEIGQRNKS